MKTSTPTPTWSPTPRLMRLSRILIPVAAAGALTMAITQDEAIFTLLRFREIAGDSLPALAISIALFAMGWLVLPSAVWRQCNPSERSVLCLAGGVPLLSCGLLVLGMGGWLAPIPVAALLAAIILTAVIVAVIRFRKTRDFPPGNTDTIPPPALATLSESSRSTRALALIAVFLATSALVMLALVALTPPLLYDVTEYHLGALMDYRLAAAAAGDAFGAARFVPVPHNYYARFPFPIEALYFAAVQLLPAAEAGPKLLNALFVALCALLLSTWMHRRGTPCALCLWGVALFLGHAALLEVSMDATIDAAVALLLVGGIVALMRVTPESPDTPAHATHAFLIPGALLLGGALASKYTTAQIYLAPVGLFIFLPALLAVWRGGHRRTIAIAMALAALPLVFWLGKNVIFYGNPLEPFFIRWFRPADTAAAWREQVYINAHFPQSILSTVYWQRLPLRLNAIGWHLLAPLVGLVLALAPAARARHNLRLLGVVVGSLLLWNLIGESQNRFLLPSIMICIVVAADVMTNLRPVAWRNALAALLLFPAVTALVGHAIKLDFSGVPAWAAGYPPASQQTSPQPLPPAARRAAYLAHNLGELGVVMNDANANLPANARVLMVYEARPWLLHRAAVYNTVFDDSELLRLAQGARNGAEVADRLRAAGITHVLVNPAELKRFLEQYATVPLRALGIDDVRAQYDRIAAPEDYYLPFQHDPLWKTLRGPVLEFLHADPRPLRPL